MNSSPPSPLNADPLSEQSITVRFVQHPEFLEAALHGFINFGASSSAVQQIADEVRRIDAHRVLIDTGGVIGQLTQSEHAELGRLIASLFGATRVAAIAPIGRPVGEIAPSARSSGGDYMGFSTRAEALGCESLGPRAVPDGPLSCRASAREFGNARHALLHLRRAAFTTIAFGTAMPRTDSELHIARRQAEQARARARAQQALVDALSREGMDAGRARRQLAELTLAAELLQDRAAYLEAAAGGSPITLGPRKAPRARTQAPLRGWRARPARPATPLRRPSPGMS
jgi:hypothetical protein